MDKENVVHIKYYFVMKKETLPLATTQTDLEHIMLHEVRHRAKYCMISLIRRIKDTDS